MRRLARRPIGCFPLFLLMKGSAMTRERDYERDLADALARIDGDENAALRDYDDVELRKLVEFDIDALDD